MTLYDYLVKIGYTEDESEETVLRLEIGLPIPESIKKDIKKYYELPTKERRY